MTEYTVCKIMHNGDLISLGGGGGGGGGYLCTYDGGGHTACSPRPGDASVAIVSTYQTGSPCNQRGGAAVTVDRNAIGPRHSIECGNAIYTTVYNCGTYICAYSNCANTQIAFFSSACGGDGKVGYIDFLLVGGGSSGKTGNNTAFCRCGGGGGGGGGVVECTHYPIKGGFYSITIGAGGAANTNSCPGCYNSGGTTSFNGIYASGGTPSASGKFCECASGADCYGGGGGGGGARGVGGVVTYYKCCPEMHAHHDDCNSYYCLYYGASGGKGYCSDISGECRSYGGGGGGGGGSRPMNCNNICCSRWGIYAGCGCDGGGDGGQGTFCGCVASDPGVPQTHKGCNATYYGGGGGGGGVGGSGAGCQGIVIIRYHTDGSDGICAECTYGGCKYTCGEYTIHCFANMSEHNEFIPVYKK